MKKNLIILLLAMACPLVFATLTSAQTYPNSNQPLGNIIPAADGFIYGSFSLKDDDGNLVSSTVYRYKHGDPTFTPVMRSETKEMTVHLVDSSGSMYGVAVEYSGSTPTTSQIYRANVDGTGFTVLKTSNVSSEGLTSLQVRYENTLYGLRSKGGTNGFGVLFSITTTGTLYTELYNFETDSDRPSSLILRFQYWDGAPLEFWGPSYTSGTHGKGALFLIAFDGSFAGYRLDLTGQGGPDDGYGPTDGEKPVATVQDVDTDGYIFCESGGAYNAGTVIMIGLDGNWKTHDFTPQYGKPSGIPAIDPVHGRLFGLGGDFETNKGFIYSLDEGLNVLADLSGSNPINYPVSLIATPDTVLYGTAQVSDLNPNGAFFSLNQDGTDFKVLFHFTDYDASSLLVTPSDGATEVSSSPQIYFQPIVGATEFTLQLSLSADFSDTLSTTTFSSSAGQLTGLAYSTTYYARVKTNVGSDYGDITTFSTGGSQIDSYVVDPANNAYFIPINHVTVTSNIVYGATNYTIELNTNSDFTGTSVVKSSITAGERSFIFDGLSYFTAYYLRVKTNVSPNWGATHTFHTVGTETYLTSPENNATGIHSYSQLKVLPSPGASFYTLELTTPAFGTYTFGITNEDLDNAFTYLFPGSTYVVRVKTDINNNYGPSRTFSVRPAEEESYVTDPPDGATGVPYNLIISVNPIPYTNRYTIELNTKPDFTGVSIVKTISTLDNELARFNLQPGTTYYNRIKTELSPVWGKTQSFTTRAVQETYIYQPEIGEPDVPVNPLIRLFPVPGATSYTVEVADNFNFNGAIVRTSTSPDIRVEVLKYSTHYWVRARSNLSSYDATGQFTTHAPEKYSFVSNPLNGATGVAVNDLKVTANIVYGATSYTIELNTKSDFTGASFVKTSAVPNQRTMIFDGLASSTTYFSRTKTNLPSNWGPIRSFTTNGTPSYVVEPANNKTEVGVRSLIKVQPVSGASSYTLELSLTSDFGMIESQLTQAGTDFAFELNYSTTYFTRVKVNSASYGAVTKFTTHAPEKYSFVSSPVNGATNVATNNLKVTANIVYGASSYTIELNTSPNFTGTSIIKTSTAFNQRTLTFNSLSPGTTYYNRTKTNLPSDWGPVRSFTTASPGAPPAMGEQTSARVFPNPFKTTFTVVNQSIDQKKTIVSLIDATGRELYKTEIMEGQSLELGEDLASGLYLLKLEQGSTVKTHRMIKNH